MYHFLPLEVSNFLREMFQRYYKNNKTVYTEQLNTREIGYIPFDGTMTRHIALKNSVELQNFLMGAAPRHLYHSVAFYDYPEKRSMQDKKWKGAEYVFDLDADHIPGADKMGYEQILLEVKKHTQRLIDKFLLGYLGIDPKDMKLFFSGARGYHIHLDNDTFYQMSSNQRREISNLVRGEGISIKTFLSAVSNASLLGKGWVTDIDRRFTDTISNLMNGTEPENIEPKIREEIIESMEKPINSKDKRRKKDIYPKLGFEKYKTLNFGPAEKTLLESIINSFKREYAVEIDEPVSTDIHRLIRFPFSLHGKTGLMVKRIEIENLKDFNPLIDAVPGQIGDSPLKIRVKAPIDMNYNGIRYKIEQEESVPTNFAIFLVLSGRGNLY